MAAAQSQPTYGCRMAPVDHSEPIALLATDSHKALFPTLSENGSRPPNMIVKYACSARPDSEILQASKVAVIGLGGIGSLVAEYLARLGVGNLVLDRSGGNRKQQPLTRSRRDPSRCRNEPVKNTDCRTSCDERWQPMLRLHPVTGDVSRTAAVAQILRELRLHLPGCRLHESSTCRQCTRSSVPHSYDTDGGENTARCQSGDLEDAMCAVRHIRPGNGCLWCNGLINPTQLAIEAKSDSERKAQAYGVQEPNPSVITLNGVAAAHAVNDFLFDFLGLRSNGDADAAYHHFHFHQRQSPARHSPSRSRMQGMRPKAGHGRCRGASRVADG